MGLWSSACLVPADGTIRPDPIDLPPEIDLSAVYPPSSFFEPDTKCNCFKVSLDRVSDLNDDSLVARFATNLGRPGRARCFDEFTTPPALRPQRIGTQLIPAESFIDFPTETVHTISVFVTDAPSFAKSSTLAPESCGEIPTGADGGVSGYHVIEHQWTVRFVDGVTDCFGCNAVGH
ncbi:MAG: hypothetical protein U1E65_24115 [Myxococcota bacterium]